MDTPLNPTHLPVFFEEAVAGLAIRPDGIYVDATFGRGGHSAAILTQLSSKGRLYLIDQDPTAIEIAHERYDGDSRVFIRHGSFSQIAKMAEEWGITGSIDGILFDLGVSSPQLDTAARGFSFLKDGPLDMRMDTTQLFNAAQFINKASHEEMVRVFRDYGEERFAKRIARAIIEARTITPLTTTGQLSAIVKEANPKWEKHKHPATRVFQAIRLHVNQELESLEKALEASYTLLSMKGRLVVISFHSLEDRIVKQSMRLKEEGVRPPIWVPVKADTYQGSFKRCGKALKPTDEAVLKNPRARSAVLRIGERIA